MNAKLFIESIIKFAAGIVLVGLLIFVPAGTVAYWPGWLLIGLLFIPMLLAGIVMMYHNPELLKRRLNAKEKRSEQGLVVKLSGLMFIISFVVAGLDYRFVWFPLPTGVIIGASAVFLIAYGLYAEVLRENSSNLFHSIYVIK